MNRTPLLHLLGGRWQPQLRLTLAMTCLLSLGCAQRSFGLEFLEKIGKPPLFSFRHQVSPLEPVHHEFVQCNTGRENIIANFVKRLDVKCRLIRHHPPFFAIIGFLKTDNPVPKIVVVPEVVNNPITLLLVQIVERFEQGTELRLNRRIPFTMEEQSLQQPLKVTECKSDSYQLSFDDLPVEQDGHIKRHEELNRRELDNDSADGFVVFFSQRVGLSFLRRTHNG